MTAESTAAPPVPAAFYHNFKTIDPDLEAEACGMLSKEAKQIVGIHNHVTAPVASVSKFNKVVDKAQFDTDIAHLHKWLMSKNMKALKFVCDDVGCQPAPKQTQNARPPKTFKKDWVDALVNWVSELYYCNLLFLLPLYLSIYNVHLPQARSPYSKSQLLK